MKKLYSEFDTKLRDELEKRKRLTREWSDYVESFAPRTSNDIKSVKKLRDLDVKKVLGKGAFGTVSLVEYGGTLYAVKEIEKV